MDIGNKIMELSGGNYGGYILTTDHIVNENENFEIVKVSYFEFYIIDVNQDKWYYLINSDSIIFSGVNKY